METASTLGVLALGYLLAASAASLGYVAWYRRKAPLAIWSLAGSALALAIAFRFIAKGYFDLPLRQVALGDLKALTLFCVGIIAGVAWLLLFLVVPPTAPKVRVWLAAALLQLSNLAVTGAATMVMLKDSVLGAETRDVRLESGFSVEQIAKLDKLPLKLASSEDEWPKGYGGFLYVADLIGDRILKLASNSKATSSAQPRTRYSPVSRRRSGGRSPHEVRSRA